MNLKFDDKGLIPVVVQDCKTNQVLMMAYMNKEALDKTIETGKMYYFSRSRNQLWLKGETSGHYQALKQLKYDCDGDTLLALVDQTGVACHTGSKTCFHNPIETNVSSDDESQYINTFGVFEELYDVIKDRQLHPIEGSYTNYLFDKGLDKILKKVGEESAETIIAAKNTDKDEIVYEVSDLIYHLSVLLAYSNITWEDICVSLKGRR